VVVEREVHQEVVPLVVPMEKALQDIQVVKVETLDQPHTPDQAEVAEAPR